MLPHRCIFIVFLICLVDLHLSLPQTYYSEADDHSYRSKPCTSIPTPATLQAVVSSALPGDVICLSPGVTYSGFTVDTPQGSGQYITIRNRDLNFLPPAGVRISPLYAPNLPRIDGRIFVSRGSRFRFVGLHFVSLQNESISLLYASKFTDHIIVDQCYSLYSASKSGMYTIIIGSSYGAIINSYIEDRSSGTLLLEGSTLKIRNNYFNNDDVFIFSNSELLSDVEIRFNYFQKRNDVVNYLGFSFTEGSRIWIDSNYIAPSNPDAGILSYMTILGTTNDITISNNYIDTCSTVIALDSWPPSTPTSSISIYGNFFADIRTTMVSLLNGPANITFSENTCIGDNNIMGTFLKFQITNMTYMAMTVERNIVSSGLYGIFASDRIWNLIPSNAFAWSDNVVVVPDEYAKAKFPSVGTIFEDSFDNISFVDPSKRDYQIQPTSVYHQNNYGKQIGADLCALVRSAKLKFVLLNCSLDDVTIQPTEILIISDILLVNGNLTMYPDSVLQFNGVSVVNITSCAQFDGTLDLNNVQQVINKTFVVAYYSCWTGSEFNKVVFSDTTSDECNQLKVEVSYQPTLVTATFVIENQCQVQTPSGTVAGPGKTPTSTGPSGTTPDIPNLISDGTLPTWFLPVVIVGSAVFLALLFIVLAVSIPALKQKVFHPKRRFPSSTSVSSA